MKKHKILERAKAKDFEIIVVFKVELEPPVSDEDMYSLTRDIEKSVNRSFFDTKIDIINVSLKDKTIEVYFGSSGSFYDEDTWLDYIDEVVYSLEQEYPIFRVDSYLL